MVDLKKSTLGHPEIRFLSTKGMGRDRPDTTGTANSASNFDIWFFNTDFGKFHYKDKVSRVRNEKSVV